MSHTPSSLARQIERMGYLQPAERPGCGNCAHAVRGTPSGAANDRWALRCSIGKFGVQQWAICNRHQSQKGTTA